MNLRKLLTFTGAATLAVMPVATAQNPTILQGSYVSNVFGQSNFVKNPNAQTNTANVTLTTATATRSTTTPLVATTEWNVTITSANGTVAWDTRTFDAGMKNQNCEARFTYRGFQATSKAQIKQGANVVAELVLTPSATDPRIASINFPCGDLSSATTFVITDTATLAGTHEIGGIYVGLATNQANVAQAEIVGITEINNCGTAHLGTASTSFSAYASVGSCNIVNSFKATTVNKDLSITIPNADPGVYYINFNGIPFHHGNNTSLCYWAIKEDTSGYISGGSYQASGSTLTSRGASQLSAYYNATTRATRTWRIVSKNNSGTGSICNVGARAFETPSTLITVSRFPSSSELVVTPETQNWFVAGTFSGGNPNLGTAPVSSLTEITNSALTFTPAANSQPAATLCSSTNAPPALSISGTTCAAGSESVGITYNIPSVGTYEVCAQGTVSVDLAANGYADTKFSIQETAINSNTATSNYSAPANVYIKAASSAVIDNKPFRVCQIISYSSIGQKAVRLMYQQSVGATINTNLLLMDSTQGRQLNWTVTPVTNQSNSALYVQGPVKAAGTGTAIPAGYVGEKIEASTSSIFNASSTLNVWSNITGLTITLTPGVWEIDGIVGIMQSCYSSNAGFAFSNIAIMSGGSPIQRVAIGSFGDPANTSFYPVKCSTSGGTIRTIVNVTSSTSYEVGVQVGSWSGTPVFTNVVRSDVTPSFIRAVRLN